MISLVQHPVYIAFLNEYLMGGFEQETTTTIAVLKNYELIAVLGFVNYYLDLRVDFVIATTGNKNWYSLELVKIFYKYCFSELNVIRVNAYIHEKNEQARKVASKFGFVFESKLADWFGHNEPGELYRILKADKPGLIVEN